jgi:hypothetical protein
MPNNKTLEDYIVPVPKPILHTCADCAYIGTPIAYMATDFLGDKNPRIGTSYYICPRCKSAGIEPIPHNTRKICRDCNYFEAGGSNIDSDGFCVLLSPNGSKVGHLETCEYWVLVD